MQRSVAAVTVGSILLAACGLDEPTSPSSPSAPIEASTTLPGPVVSDPPPDRQDTVEEDVPTTTDVDVDEILAELEAAGFCDPIDVEDEGDVTAMHFVVEGELQAPCYSDPPGEPDARLLAAWDALVAITPNELVDDVSLLAGYEACSGCDTLAFVVALDTEATFFLMAIDVVAGADDPDELRLTMMHELTHVFAQEPGSQLVVQDVDDECATYFNGVGCFTDDSYMWAWIQEFWPQDELDGLPADGSPDDRARRRGAVSDRRRLHRFVCRGASGGGLRRDVLGIRVRRRDRPGARRQTRVLRSVSGVRRRSVRTPVPSVSPAPTRTSKAVGRERSRTLRGQPAELGRTIAPPVPLMAMQPSVTR